MVWPHFFWQKSRALPPFPGREVQVLSQMHKDQGSEIQSNSMAFNRLCWEAMRLLEQCRWSTRWLTMGGGFTSYCYAPIIKTWLTNLHVISRALFFPHKEYDQGSGKNNCARGKLTLSNSNKSSSKNSFILSLLVPQHTQHQPCFHSHGRILFW